MKRYILLIINILLLIALIPPIYKSGLHNYSSDAFCFYGTVTLSVDYNDDGYSIPSGTQFTNPWVGTDNYVTCTHTDYPGKHIRIPITSFTERGDLSEFVNREIQEAESNKSAALTNAIKKVTVLTVLFTCLSLLWLILLKKKSYCVPAYCVFTVLLIIITINNYIYYI